MFNKLSVGEEIGLELYNLVEYKKDGMFYHTFTFEGRITEIFEQADMIAVEDKHGNERAFFEDEIIVMKL